MATLLDLKNNIRTYLDDYEIPDIVTYTIPPLDEQGVATSDFQVATFPVVPTSETIKKTTTGPAPTYTRTTTTLVLNTDYTFNYDIGRIVLTVPAQPTDQIDAIYRYTFFSNKQLVEAINTVIQSMMFPLIYVPVVDTTITTTALREYPLPTALTGVRIYSITATEKDNYLPRHDWDIIGTNLYFNRVVPSGRKLRIRGIKPHKELLLDTDVTDLPLAAQKILPIGCAGYLFSAKEARRTRTLVDSDPALAVEPGTHQKAASSYYKEFWQKMKQITQTRPTSYRMML